MDAPLADDGGLMLAWAGGDAAAFGELYARHKGPLYRFLLKTVKDRAIADELFQETWSRVIAARERYQPQAKFTTWLLQIAHNLVVDRFRRQRPHASGDEADSVFRNLDAPDDEQRVAFLLRVESGLGLEEIAAITGAGRETVKSRLRYALARIRARFAS